MSDNAHAEERPHVPVLPDEVISGLAVKPGGTYIDSTFGRGGHFSQIAKRLTDGRILGIDRDREAIEYAKRHFPGGNTRVVHGRFSQIAELAAENGISCADGILLDAGVSSPQFDDSSRGFTFRTSGTLDMRMDTADSLTAKEIVNTYSKERLVAIFRDYGEERFAVRIADAIIRRRERAELETTEELSELIKAAYPAKFRRDKHPAKKVFMAIRYEVNSEVQELTKFLETAPGLLKKGGRLAVISFNSIEDRLVKTSYSRLADGCVCPKNRPCVCGFVQKYRTVGKVITAGRDELLQNPRSAPAKLRILERIAD
ncbi:MAG: 16S rRNA (cytosine(1402)-N(4))-methyltransferase RsmH [Oscillospiraceae bacterium]|jgi:16S rRNA (cytosine1402-N4)-methyltransferase|nr:16S rRNA (cytosine(1402)-N(4))-methyltransferase RsmH [Oscillospiraceae bacterium]